MQAEYEKLVERAARVICAGTNIAPPDVTEIIFDQPDDLVWITRDDVHRLVPRWMLYQDRARAVLAAVGTGQMIEVLMAIFYQLQRARSPNSLLAAMALDEIERLVRLIVQPVVEPGRAS